MWSIGENNSLPFFLSVCLYVSLTYLKDEPKGAIFPSQEPFGDHLKRMMEMVHEYMNLPPDFRLRECGTQEYEADVVILERQGKNTVYSFFTYTALLCMFLFLCCFVSV